MRKTHRNGPGAGVVVAARAGDRRALDQLVAECLPLVYNIVGRALNGHADVDDVVQETLLRMVRGLTELRDPGAFRSWLVAITIRQVRDHARLRATARDRSAGLEAAEQIPDPGLDFAGLTILRLGLTEQRREVAEATRWLDQDDRELLSLWWLEESGELDRPELASALGLSDRHAAVRVQRMKKQMEAARVVVRALNATPRCAGLQAPADNWDGVPSPLWRKRFARHVRGCPVCGGMEEGLFPMDRLLSGLPLLALPPALDPARVVAAVVREAGTATGTGGPWSSGGSGNSAGHKAVGGARHAHRAARPASRVFSAPVVSGAAVAAVVAVALVAAGLTTGSSGTPGKAAPPARSAPAVAAAASPTPSARSASPSPSPSTSKSPTKKATPKPTHKAPAAPPAVAVASTSKKGVGVWTFPGVSKALAASGASWYYTWSTTHSEVTSPPSAGFVPMIWGRDSVTPQNLSQARSQGPYLLGFNEPDMAQQSNMTVEQALSLWPQLMDAGRVLGSPAVAYGGDTPGGWLDRFMSGAKAKGYRVDFITLHWYGGDFRTAEAVGQLTSYLNAVYQRYHKPIWLTEYALIDFSHGTRFPSADQQAAFVTASTKALEGLPYLQRYAWFGLGADASAPSSGLFTDGTTATAAGRAFQAAHS
ncbi:sigma-70 family RNA polymerase sigma factor [Streptomyces sp. MI02-7b]|uniref:sigma-70 family RNA polymerase sigma factor n=1 Tax=Streptomyces sp. MI02-7b TaxID=462941 RepID=UPI0029B003AF|nr:sigma-70 family RNA polymerase sigma factor [Streptomyces sp. MI02-7b]MDX3072751.1 sigma-70 family RNA polymerase sigma factor [Streptomyces sp. MI02-7b]